MFPPRTLLSPSEGPSCPPTTDLESLSRGYTGAIVDTSFSRSFPYPLRPRQGHSIKTYVISINYLVNLRRWNNRIFRVIYQNLTIMSDNTTYNIESFRYVVKLSIGVIFRTMFHDVITYFLSARCKDVLWTYKINVVTTEPYRVFFT